MENFVLFWSMLLKEVWKFLKTVFKELSGVIVVAVIFIGFMFILEYFPMVGLILIGLMLLVGVVLIGLMLWMLIDLFRDWLRGFLYQYKIAKEESNEEI